MRALEAIGRAPSVPSKGRWSLGRRPSRRTLIGSASVASFVAAWQLVGSRNVIRADLISYPTQILGVGAELVASGELSSHAVVSLQELVYGFTPAVALGMLIGFAMGHFRRLRLMFDPLTMALYTTPRIALLPLLVIWFGIGMESKAVIVFLSAVFPILVNTTAGVRQVEPMWIRAARSFGANQLQVVTKVLLPGALPAVMAGIRLGVGRAIIGVIVGEMYVSLAGMGRLIQLYGNAGRAAELIVLGAIISAFGFLCIMVLGLFESRLGRWSLELER